MRMPIGQAAVNALLGYAVVFVGLVLLMCVVVLMGRVMERRTRAAAPVKPAGDKEPASGLAPAAKDAPLLDLRSQTLAPGSAGAVKRYDVPDREAAMLMAIVAEAAGKPLNELRFKSIREVK